MQMHCGSRLSGKFPNFVSLHCRQWATRQLGKENTQTQTFNKTQTVIVSNIYPTRIYTHSASKKGGLQEIFSFHHCLHFFCKYLNLQVIFNPSPQSIMYCRVIIRSCTLSCRAPAVCTVSNITHGFIDSS